MINFEELNYRIFEKTNMARLKHSLNRVEYSKELSLISSLHSTQMKKYSFFSHDNPYNPLLKDLKDRVLYFKLPFSKVTENIADVPFLDSNDESVFEVRKVNQENLFYSIKTGKQFFYYNTDSFSEFLVSAWMNSKGHRKNILDKEVTHLGCGAVLYFKEINDIGDTLPQLKVTQNFGRR
ncbi:CAP domain-containing protein [Chryseobacterium sp. SL1]|nr:CAP domain-containing protein [Chryseobacterium sp. SL1]